MNKEKKDIVSGNKTTTLNSPLMITDLSKEQFTLSDFFYTFATQPFHLFINLTFFCKNHLR